MVDSDGITVLCSANPKGEREHTLLLRLTNHGSLLWERHYPAGQGAGRAITSLPGGGFAIAGEVQRSEMEYEAHLMRLDADGWVTAESTFGPPGVTGFVATAMLNDGSLLAAGTAGGKGWLVCADNELRTHWDLLIEDVDDIEAVAGFASGTFAIVGTQDKSRTAFGIARLALLASDRRVRWQHRLPTAGQGEAAALVALLNDDLAAVGHRSASERDAAQFWVVRVDKAGEVSWERVLGPPDEERRGRAIVPLPDGGIAVAGDAVRGSSRGLRLVRLAADGTTVWECSYGGGEREYDVARGLARTADGGLVLVGSTTARGPSKTNVWVLRLDGNGRVLWEQIFGSTN